MKFSKIELIKYFLLQNRYSWSSLSQEQKKIIHNANMVHNNIREDYKNPELYQDGLNYNSNVDRGVYFRGKITKYILNKYNPKSVLEIGPGSGFITKTILNNKPLEYTAVDIVKPFLDFCQNAIIHDKKVTTRCDFICGAIDDINLNKKFDIIFFLSTLHHIPNREEFFNSLLPFCHEKTMIVSVEPTHYLLRIRQLLRRLPLYISKKYVGYNNYQNLSTHHFLTLDEYKSFSEFSIIDVGFGFPKKIPLMLRNKYSSTEIYAVLQPKKKELN